MMTKFFEFVDRNWKKLNRMSFIILIAFGIFGAIFASVFFHELSHQIDFEKYSYDSYTCLFVQPKNISSIFSSDSHQ